MCSGGGDTEKDRLIADALAEGVKKASFLSILHESRQEWLFVAIGILAAIVQGVVMPAFSLFFTQIFSVRAHILHSLIHNVTQAFSKEGDELMRECRFWALMLAVLGTIDGITYFLGVSVHSEYI